MDKTRLGLLFTRAIQLLAAAIVLGISVSLYKWHHHNDTNCDDHSHEFLCHSFFKPWASFFAFGAFVGVLGLLDACAGMASTFVSIIPWLVIIALDALAAIFYLAGGVTLAVKWAKSDGIRPCDKMVDGDGVALAVPPCSRYTADTAFLFVGLVVTLAALALTYVYRKFNGLKGNASAPINREL